MKPELHEIKQRLQGLFTDGLVTIVGSGLSLAEGIPGMWDLSKHLQTEIPKHLSEEDIPDWQKISELLLADLNLEEALHKAIPSTTLEERICDVTSQFILEAETKVIQEVFSGDRTLRFTRLLNHFLKNNSGIPVITTNYDRLIELACEVAGVGVDTLFVGNYFGRLDEKASLHSFCRDIELQRNKQPRRVFTNRVVLLKPHGSLDWCSLNGHPIRSNLPMPARRLIITPGLNKYLGGYSSPFDKHREKANFHIDRASKYLIIGYGFNDSHLEAHLKQQLKSGRTGYVLTYSLSPNGRSLISESENLFAITADKDLGDGFRLISKENDVFYPDLNLWDLNTFVKEVFNHD